jgi:hypothetical protein
MTATGVSRLSKIAHIEIKLAEVTNQPFPAADNPRLGCASDEGKTRARVIQPSSRAWGLTRAALTWL